MLDMLPLPVNRSCALFCFSHLFTWDLREVKDIEARIKSANKLFGSAKATFWSNSRVPFDLRMGFYKAIIVNVLLWGCESWAIQSKEVQALRVFQFRCLRSILKINVMHKISRAKILELCQVQDIIQTMDHRRACWIEKLSYMDFTRCPSGLLSYYYQHTDPSAKVLDKCLYMNGNEHHLD